MSTVKVGALTIPTEGVYALAQGFGPGANTLRRQTAQSPFVAGRVLVASIADAGTFTLGVIVLAATPAQLQARFTALVAAFQAPTYTLTYSHGPAGATVDYAWTCEPADYSVGSDGNFDSQLMANLVQTVTFSIPHAPTPVSGPF